MNCPRPLSPCIAAGLLAGAFGTATAAPLSVVTVSAPAINCVFETDCTVVVTDTVGPLTLPGYWTGNPRLQSRTFLGQAGAPGAGKTAYEYRIDLTGAQAVGDIACVTDLAIDFGPIAKLQYNRGGPLDDVFVITKGGLGTIGLAYAEQTGSIVTFTFSQPVCAADPSTPGQTTFFFGLASEATPVGTVAKVTIPGLEDPLKVRARAPKH
jgi:hypothetical protein